jgi:hypothetical protein
LSVSRRSSQILVVDPILQRGKDEGCNLAPSSDADASKCAGIESSFPARDESKAAFESEFSFPRGIKAYHREKMRDRSSHIEIQHRSIQVGRLRDAASALVADCAQYARCPSTSTANLINMRRPIAVTCEQVTAGLISSVFYQSFISSWNKKKCTF